jgi:hypothetical protein
MSSRVFPPIGIGRLAKGVRPKGQVSEVVLIRRRNRSKC